MSIIGRWTFAGLSGPYDETENWGPVVFSGTAALTHRGLVLKDGGHAYVRPAPGATFRIKEKTLISWVIIDSLAQLRPAGSAMTLDAQTLDQFDGIVFGETADATWIAGSTGLKRTQTNDSNPKETETGKLVKLAITYRDAGGGAAEVKIYRNDVLACTYTQGTLPEWTQADVEVVFGARHTHLDKVLGSMNATIVAAELHDACLSSAELAQRVHTDPSGFVVPTISLRSVSNPTRYITTNTDGATVDLAEVSANSEALLKCQATFTPIPGLADPTLFSLQVSSPSGSFLVATATGVAVKAPDGTNAFRSSATFKRVGGLAGSGYSFESLTRPGCFLRNGSFKLQLEAKADTDAFRKEASFLEVDPFLPALSTALPLETHVWYFISNHYYAPDRMLGVTSDDKIAILTVPSAATDSIDHLLWRLEPYPDMGMHRWRLINKKSGDAKRLDCSGEGPTLGSSGDYWGQKWSIRPIPWQGSDYFAMTNDMLEPKGETLDCGGLLGHDEVTASPRVSSLNLVCVGQHWRFTLMQFVDGAERPAVPDRVAGRYCGPNSVTNLTPPQNHADHIAVYPKYTGALGMDYVATSGVSDWAIRMARTVLTNLMLTFKDRSNIAKFAGYRILLVGDSDKVLSSLPEWGFPQADDWRGGTSILSANITEEMMCRTGVTNRPGDVTARVYDQVFHEFGHAIAYLLALKDQITPVQGGKYDACTFAWWVQSWFGQAQVFGSAGTRSGFLKAQPAPAAFLLKLFSANREWRPLPIYRRYGR